MRGHTIVQIEMVLLTGRLGRSVLKAVDAGVVSSFILFFFNNYAYKIQPSACRKIALYTCEVVNSSCAQDSPMDDGERPRATGSILGTPGRIISGVISWLSPWKSKSQQQDDSAEGSSPQGSSFEEGTSPPYRDSSG